MLDVSVIVVACFDNPLKEHSVSFLSDVLARRKRVALPVSSMMGAYHIATRYLRVAKISAKKVLGGILATRSPALYPQITPDLAIDALEYATYYDIESWDGYLVSLAGSLGTTIVYSLDKELAKTKEITVINPFPEEAVEQYHEFMRKTLDTSASN